jgi:hypothetical protein
MTRGQEADLATYTEALMELQASKAREVARRYRLIMVLSRVGGYDRYPSVFQR